MVLLIHTFINSGLSNGKMVKLFRKKGGGTNQEGFDFVNDFNRTWLQLVKR